MKSEAGCPKAGKTGGRSVYKIKIRSFMVEFRDVSDLRPQKDDI